MSGIRAMQLVNFKGDKYLTETEVDEKISAATGGENGLIDSETGNLRSDLNPIYVASMQNATGVDDVSKIKFIGNCNVQYGTDGVITIRIGDNLNCSLFNTTDGISTATVSASKSGDSAGYVSADYSGVSPADGSTTYRIFQGTDKISATCGSTASTESGPTSANGNEVHFEDNANGKFKVYIKNGKDESASEYVIGPITANGTYYAKLNGEGDDVSGIKCTIANFGTEPKSATGATGYSGNVAFEIVPSSIYADSSAFAVVKIEMLEGSSVVGTWTNSGATNGTFFYLKETTKPGTPASVDYSISASEKWISGVKYLTTSSTATATAAGITNIGYPAYASNKVYVAPSGGTWFAAYNATATSKLSNWTTVKDTSTGTFTGDAKALNIGEWANPQVSVNGVNYNGSGTAATSAKTNNALYVCDANGYTSTTHGSFSEAGRLNSNYEASFNSQTSLVASENTDLQIFNGYVQYPNTNFTSYNKNGATSVNPDYSSASGTRYYYCTLSKSGTIASGTITLATIANPSTAYLNGSFKIEISKNGTSNWCDVKDCATSYSWGASASTIGFELTQASDYPENTVYVRISMTADAGVVLGNITLA